MVRPFSEIAPRICVVRISSNSIIYSWDKYHTLLVLLLRRRQSAGGGGGSGYKYSKQYENFTNDLI